MSKARGGAKRGRMKSHDRTGDKGWKVRLSILADGCPRCKTRHNWSFGFGVKTCKTCGENVVTT